MMKRMESTSPSLLPQSARRGVLQCVAEVEDGSLRQERQGRSRLQQSRKGHSPLEHDRFIDGTLGAYRDLVRSYISVWPLEGDVTDDIVDSIVSQRLLTKTAYDYVVRHGKTLTKPINSGNADSPSREKLRGVESALHAMGLAAHGLVAALTSYRNELEREADLIGQNLCDMKQ